MSAKLEHIDIDTVAVTFVLGTKFAKTDLITKKIKHDEDLDLSATLSALGDIIKAVKSNVAIRKVVGTSYLHRAEYIPCTEWTSGTIIYIFGIYGSYTEVTLSGMNDILIGLQSWSETLSAASSALYDTEPIPEYTEILPGLYVGSVHAVRDLVGRGVVKRIVNCAKEFRNVGSVDVGSYLKVPLDDSGSWDDQVVFADNFKHIMEFLDKESFAVSPVLIHCQMGISRSPYVTAAYLVHSRQQKSVSEAKLFVKKLRPIAFSGEAKNTYDTALVEILE